jgi:hypothetical protein
VADAGSLSWVFKLPLPADSRGLPGPCGCRRWSLARDAARARCDRIRVSNHSAVGSIPFQGLPGDVAEWLRSGLQSRLHRFDSGRRL